MNGLVKVEFYSIENYEEAIKCYDKAIEIDPNNGVVWCSKAISLGITKRYHEFIKCYDKAIEIDPSASIYFLSFWDSMEKISRSFEESSIEITDNALALIWKAYTILYILTRQKGYTPPLIFE